MSDVFISYSSSDRTIAKEIAHVIERLGLMVWWDRTILPGKTFDEVIEAELSSAKCVIVIWSKNSVESEWVKVEASEAMKRRILIPVMIDNIKIPLEFRRLQSANLMNWHGDTENTEFKYLVQAVYAKIGHTTHQEKSNLSLKKNDPVVQESSTKQNKEKFPFAFPVESNNNYRTKIDELPISQVESKQNQKENETDQKKERSTLQRDNNSSLAIFFFGILSVILSGPISGIPVWIIGKRYLKRIDNSNSTQLNIKLVKIGILLGIIGCFASPIPFLIIDNLRSGLNFENHKEIMQADFVNIAAVAHRYYLKPKALGGGGKSYQGFELPNYDFFKGRGRYRVTAISENEVSIEGFDDEVKGGMVVTVNSNGEHLLKYSGAFK